MATPPLFPDRPFCWIARGKHRDGGLRGHSASVCVYTARNSLADARRAAEEEHGRWLRVAVVSPIENPRRG